VVPEKEIRDISKKKECEKEGYLRKPASWYKVVSQRRRGGKAPSMRGLRKISTYKGERTLYREIKLELCSMAGGKMEDDGNLARGVKRWPGWPKRTSPKGLKKEKKKKKRCHKQLTLEIFGKSPPTKQGGEERPNVSRICHSGYRGTPMDGYPCDRPKKTVGFRSKKASEDRPLEQKGEP